MLQIFENSETLIETGIVEIDTIWLDIWITKCTIYGKIALLVAALK